MSWQSLVGKNLRELRLVFCQTTSRSQGMRDFVSKNYFDIKKNNENFPFIVRECEDADPIIIARYRFGVEKKAHTAGLNDKEIETVIQKLVNQADEVNKQLQKQKYLWIFGEILKKKE